MGDPIRLSFLKETVKVIREEGLVEQAEQVGKCLKSNLDQMINKYPGVVSNSRGLGIMCAIDVKDTETRDKVRASMMNKGILASNHVFFIKYFVFINSCYISSK